MISPLSAEDVPGEAVALKAELTEMLPFAPIVSLLIELDKRTGYLDCFTHAGGKQARSSELKRNLLAQSTNLGLTRMADACGISYDVLSWTAEWYVREETLRAANLAIIDYRGTVPLTPIFGTGTLSSSDGQWFPTRGKSVTARALSRYFADEGLSTYTHVTDQHTTYGTKIIGMAKREAHFVLDEILGNATDIPITEHATDTHGAAGQLRAIRPAGVAALAAYPGPRQDHPVSSGAEIRGGVGVPAGRAAVDPARQRRPDCRPLRRPAAAGRVAEVRARHRVPAGRETLGIEPAEFPGCGVEGVRRAAPHDLRRPLPVRSGLSAQDLSSAQQGRVAARPETGPALRPRGRHPRPPPRTADRAGVVPDAGHQRRDRLWTTEYYGLAVDSMRTAGRRIDDEVLAHISPAHSENINFFGSIDVDIEGELAQLGPTGYRPLRVRDTLF